MTAYQAGTLLLAGVAITGALLVEHGAGGRAGRRWRTENRYAAGLVTELTILLAWACLLDVRITPVVAAAMILVAAAAGAPIYALLGREREDELTRQVRRVAELEAKVAALEAVGGSRRRTRADQLTTSSGAILHQLVTIIEDFNTAAETIRDAYAPFVNGDKGKADRC